MTNHIPRRPLTVSRRDFLKGSGALIVGFSFAGLPPPSVASTVAQTEGQPVGSLNAATLQGGFSAPSPGNVDSWVVIGRDNSITILTGRVELGTGVETALAQIAADELYVPFDQVTVIAGDTGMTPDEGYTSGSQTIQRGGVSVRNACAEARQALLELGGLYFATSPEDLVTREGTVIVTGDSSSSVSYGDLIGTRRFERAVSGSAPTRDPDTYEVVGQSIARVDLPPKIFGQAIYIQDLRLPGMLHGRVIRPPTLGATLQGVDVGSVQEMPGFVQVVREDDFLGVVAEREDQAIEIARQLDASWQTTHPLPDQPVLFDVIRTMPAEDRVTVSEGDVEGVMTRAARALSATYTQPFQMHGSIGPSCAVADVRPDRITVYSSTQGVYPLQGALAQLIGVDADQVHVMYVEGAGCYGHNGFDDAAGDALLLSKAVGKPVRVQWMRSDEHIWEPKGPAMLMDVRGGLDAQGNVMAWDFEVWTPTHSTRPGAQAGNLLPGQLMQAPTARNGTTGGDRNAPTNYTFANNRVTVHWLTSSLLRPSALRGLGGPGNTFANESFMDELAAAAGADPVEFRLRYVDDPRGRAVIEAAARAANWQTHPSFAPSGVSGSTGGRGIAYVQYENDLAYAASIADVDVDRSTGQIHVRRVTIAHDCGLIINPDGLRNQIEGNVIQSTSRALLEQVEFDQGQVTSVDWAHYPILRFQDVPDVEIVLIDHPEKPALGAGEPATLPTAAAIANAVFDATGVRLRSVPFTADIVKAALASA